MSVENVISVIDFVEKRRVTKGILILLNVLLMFTLTHYCYTWLFGVYTLENTGAVDVWNYFVSGRFLVPFILFVLIWLTTEFIGTALVNKFATWVLGLALPLKRLMLENDSFMKIGWLRRLTQSLSQDTVTRNAAWNQDPRKIEQDCALGQKFIRDALMVAVRFAISVVVVCIGVKEFSIYLLILSLLALVIGFYTARLFYLMLEMVPFAIVQYQDAARRINAEKKISETIAN